MAAEYEVNIKINTQQIERELGKIDKTVSKIGKPKNGGKKSGVLMDDAELKRLQQAGIYLGQAVQRTDTLARAQDKRARLMNKINELESKGVNVSRLRQQMGKATKQLADKQFGLLEKEFRILAKSVRLEESKLRIKRNQAAADRERIKFLAGADVGRGQFGPVAPAVQGPRQMIASPIGGAVDIKGSPAFKRRQQRIKRLEQVGLGAGFPLLFGGGPGSVLGGAAGGLTGSFGAQIAFSAIGQQIDQFIASVASVGTALTSASGTVEMFREKNLFSSDAVKEHAFQLEEQGKMQELATLLTKDLASQIGKNAVENFQALGGEVKEFLGIINRLFLAIQGLVAGPLAGFLSAINSVLGGVSTDVQFGSLRGSLTGDAAAQFEAIVAEARGTRKLTGREKQTALRQGTSTDPVAGKLTTAVKEAVLKDPRVAKLRQSIDVTGQTSLDDTLGNQTSRKAAREAAQLQKRLDRLDAERQKVQDISSLQDKIAAAEQAKDQFLVIRLKGEQKLKDIETKRLKDLAGVTKQSEIRKINELAAAKVIAAQADTTREINQLEFERQERFDNRIQSLDYQLKIAEATTREEKERLRIEQEIKKLRDSGQFTESQLFEIKSRMEQLSDKNSPLNKFIQQTREEIERLNDPIFRVIELSKTLGDAFSESFRGIIDGSMTAQQALANLFQRTADHFIDMAAQMIAAQIRMQAVNLFMSFFNPFGNLMKPGGRYEGMPKGQLPATPPPLPPLPGKALGGAVGAGQPYMVGERGPELFVPGAKGNIVPNSAMGGANVVVNVDASGSNVEGNADQASQLGKVIGIAVQQELVKQKRPGGLLAM